MEQTLLKLKGHTRTELESIVASPNPKKSKMLSSLTEREIKDIEMQTERLSKCQLPPVRNRGHVP